MELDLNWINILILFGAIQGIVFTGILLSNKNHPGRLFLASVIFAMVYNALETFNWSAGLDKYSIFFDFFPYVAIFLVGPGFYLYYKSLLIRGFVAGRNEMLLFFFPFLFQLVFTTIKAIGYFAYFQLNWKEIAVPLTWLFHVYDLYSEIWSLFVFLLFTLLSMNFVRKNILPDKSDLRQKEISHWAKSLLVFQMVFAIGWTLTLLAPIWYKVDGSHYYPIELFLVLFLYWSAIAGFWKVKSIQKDMPKETKPKAFVTLELLRSAMEKDKLFLDPNLSLQSLANHMGINAKEISYAINQAGNTNFNDFVNNKRIDAFCERMVKENKSNLTIFGIAQECGFQSPATFQRAFKKAKNMSPKRFLSKREEKKAKM